VLELNRPVSSEAAVTRKRGRPGWGIFSVVRALLAVAQGARQEELAEFAGVSQPRVSQALRELAALGLAMRSPQGWIVTDKAAAIAWWSAHYPGPGGLTSHWYGLDPVVQQAYRIHELLASAGSRPAVSGDVAADLVAPWRTPRHALLYAERGADLSAAGLTPAGAEEGTLTLILPADRAVWPISRAPWPIGLTGYGNVARAGALQVLYDLTDAGGPDAADGSAGLAGLDALARPRRMTSLDLIAGSRAEQAGYLALADIARLAEQTGIDYRLVDGQMVGLHVAASGAEDPALRQTLDAHLGVGHQVAGDPALLDGLEASRVRVPSPPRRSRLVRTRR
jgi:hypothetical protein